MPVQARERRGKAGVACKRQDFHAAVSTPIDGSAELVELAHQLVLQLLADVLVK